MAIFFISFIAVMGYIVYYMHDEKYNNSKKWAVITYDQETIRGLSKKEAEDIARTTGGYLFYDV